MILQLRLTELEWFESGPVFITRLFKQLGKTTGHFLFDFNYSHKNLEIV